REEAPAHCPYLKAQQIAELKARAVGEILTHKKGLKLAQRLAKSSLQPIIVAADTVVVLGRTQILGIPSSAAEAKQMLKKLSGKTHQVITGMCLYLPRQDKRWRGGEISRVTFNRIGDDLLLPYLATQESLDKAGAYGIQGAALTFISRVQGSYSNVVGFPLDRFIVELKKFLHLPKTNWQRCFK
ncbi:MAG: Maf family protein, partial [Bacteriovoracaceae bacterium]|nr:Maf family protein [Bacteriovoracaceae bacterium]